MDPLYRSVVGRRLKSWLARADNTAYMRIEGHTGERATPERAEERLRILEQALSASGSGVVVADATRPNRPVIYASEGYERITGRTAEGVAGRPLLSAGVVADPASHGLSSAVLEGREWSEVLRIRHRNGTLLYCEVKVVPVRDEARNVDRLVVVIADATRRRRAEEALREGNERFKRVVEQAADSLIVHDTGGRIVDANRRACESLGYAREELLGMNVADVEAGFSREKLAQMWRGVLPDSPLVFDGMYRRKDGRTFPVDVRVGLFRSGSRTLLLSLARDVAERRRSEDALKESEQLLRQVFERSVDALFLCDASGRVVDCNPEACRSLGYSREEMLQLRTGDFVVGLPPHGRRTERGDAMRRFAAGAVAVGEYRRKDGTTFPVEVGESNVSYRGEPLVLTSARDLTERKALEGRLAHLALHDPLTDLPNRTLLMERLEHALHRLRPGRDGSPQHVAALFLDLDDFKVVNDSLGHGMGDRLLVEVAHRIERALRSGDTASRLGGDEFVVLLEDLDGPDEADRVAERVARSLRDPFLLDGCELFVTCSIGVAFAGPRRGAVTAEDLLREADIAMYGSKKKGKDRREVFDPSMGELALERLKLETDLRRAAGRPDEEFVVYYQPQVELATGEVRGFEALLRWRRPGRGMVLPGEFVPCAEETGLIVPIGRWVLEEACRQTRVWQESWDERRPGQPVPTISVNLSARQFRAPDLVAQVERVLSETGLDPRTLDLEITETVIMDDADEAVRKLEELKALGLKLAIDDFGTGYSSMSYLKRFPVDILKIDKSFVDGLGQDPEASAFLSTIVGLARALNLGVVAEGVETTDQLRHLLEAGSDLAQGYHFSKPLPSESVSRLLTQRHEARRGA